MKFTNLLQKDDKLMIKNVMISSALHLFLVVITALTFQDAEKNGHLWVKRNQLPEVKDRRCVWDLEKEG